MDNLGEHLNKENWRPLVCLIALLYGETIKLKRKDYTLRNRRLHVRVNGEIESGLSVNTFLEYCDTADNQTIDKVVAKLNGRVGRYVKKPVRKKLPKTQKIEFKLFTGTDGDSW